MPSAMRYLPFVKPRSLCLNKMFQKLNTVIKLKLRNISLTLVWPFWRAHCLSPPPLASALDSTIPFAEPNLQQQQQPVMKRIIEDFWE